MKTSETATSRIDGRDLTTEDLDNLRMSVPPLCEKFGLRHGPEAVARPADIYLSASTCSLESAFAVAADSGSSVVFPEFDRFDPNDLIADDSPSRDDPEVAKILRAANQRRDQLIGFTLHWGVGGLLFSWQANAAWADEFNEKIMIATNNAGSERMTDFQARMAVSKANAQKSVEELMAHPQFRAAPARQRAAVAKGLLPASDDIESGRDLALSTVSSSAATECSRLELELKARLNELAADLAATPEWARTPGARARKALALDFLSRVTGGWTMPAALGDALRDKAVEVSGIPNQH